MAAKTKRNEIAERGLDTLYATACQVKTPEAWREYFGAKTACTWCGFTAERIDGRHKVEKC